MRKSIIPWHVFREAIAAQDPGLLESWLARWGFTDDGVLLVTSENYPVEPVLSFTQETARLFSQLSEL